MTSQCEEESTQYDRTPAELTPVIVPLSDSEDDEENLTPDGCPELVLTLAPITEEKVPKKGKKTKRVITPKIYEHLDKIREKSIQSNKERSRKVKEHDKLIKELEEAKKVISALATKTVEEPKQEETTPTQQIIQQPTMVPTIEETTKAKTKSFQFGIGGNKQNLATGFIKRKI
jgi:SET domain-containing protein